MNTKLEHLKACLEKYAPLVVAYSGGVDSAFLLAYAHEILGSRVLGVIADSPSLPRQALNEALQLAEERGIHVEVVHTEEMANSDYVSNPVNRCYFCKAELFQKLETLVRERGYCAIAYGENADDARQLRPGVKAAAEFSVLAPLKAARLTKEEIRVLSRMRNLPTADAPAQPCLSSRIPHGTPVTVEALSMIEAGEKVVRALGFKVFRVRHLTETVIVKARLQIDRGELKGLLPATRIKLIQGLKEVGYGDVEIDPNGYKAS